MWQAGGSFLASPFSRWLATYFRELFMGYDFDYYAWIGDIKIKKSKLRKWLFYFLSGKVN